MTEPSVHRAPALFCHTHRTFLSREQNFGREDRVLCPLNGNFCNKEIAGARCYRAYEQSYLFSVYDQSSLYQYRTFTGVVGEQPNDNTFHKKRAESQSTFNFSRMQLRQHRRKNSCIKALLANPLWSQLPYDPMRVLEAHEHFFFAQCWSRRPIKITTSHIRFLFCPSFRKKTIFI